MTSFTPLKIAVVGIAGKWSTESLADKIEERTGFRLIIDIEKVVADLDSPNIYFNDYCLCNLDGIIIKKISETYSPKIIDRLEILRFAESCGVKVFSAPNEIIRLVNRISCTVSLLKANIPMPPTTFTEDLDKAFLAVKHYRNAILKPLFSTKARGMLFINESQSDREILDQLKAHQNNQGFFYVQKKLNLPGQDLGLVFLNNQYQGAYARIQGKKSWNTTIDSGGRYDVANPTDDIIELAYKAQSIFNLDYTTVDIAETDQGPVCFEVSAFGGFKGLYSAQGVDMAKVYVDMIIHKILEIKT